MAQFEPYTAFYEEYHVIMNASLATAFTEPSQAESRVIAAAIHCFTEKGLQQTNMEDVAKQAGMARSSLYRHFKDKDQLIIKVMEQESLSMALELAAKIKSDNLGEFIIEGTLLAIDKIPKHPVLAKMFEADALGTANRIMFTANSLNQVVHDVIAPVLDAAKQKGEINNDLDANMLIDWLVRIVVSMVTIPSKYSSSKKQKRAMLEAMLLPALSA